MTSPVSPDAAPPGPAPRERRVVRLDLEFDGARFCGWQRQDGARTVQGEVEEALARLTGAPTSVVGAGRTDAGVHARHMVASFMTESSLSAADFERALDALLPADIGVLGAADAPAGFHAIRDARWKWYRYSILPARRRHVHRRGAAWRVPPPLDLPTLRAGLSIVRGRHDFRRFQKSGSPRKDSVRTIFHSGVATEAGLVHVDLVGDGFLYGMVRLLVGTLVSSARRADPDAAARRMRALLDTECGPHRVGASAPAHGLWLMAVGLEGDPPPAFVDGAVEVGRIGPA